MPLLHRHVTVPGHTQLPSVRVLACNARLHRLVQQKPQVHGSTGEHGPYDRTQGAGDGGEHGGAGVRRVPAGEAGR